MNNLLKFGVVVAAAAGLAGTVAKADTVSFAFSLDGGATITQIAPTTTIGSISTLAATEGAFTITASGTASSGLTLPTLFISNTIDITSTSAGNLILYVTDSGITAPTGSDLYRATLTSNGVLNATLTMLALLDTTNKKPGDAGWAPPTIGGSASFTGPGVATEAGVFAPAAPYSVTEEYRIAALQGSNVNATIDVSVPGPILGAGLPGLLAACGGLLALARRRRQQSA
jgi:hypothetical protein